MKVCCTEIFQCSITTLACVFCSQPLEVVIDLRPEKGHARTALVIYCLVRRLVALANGQQNLHLAQFCKVIYRLQFTISKVHIYRLHNLDNYSSAPFRGSFLPLCSAFKSLHIIESTFMMIIKRLMLTAMRL